MDCKYAPPRDCSWVGRDPAPSAAINQNIYYTLSPRYSDKHRHMLTHTRIGAREPLAEAQSNMGVNIA
jgi:hypothetical protein